MASPTASISILNRTSGYSPFAVWTHALGSNLGGHDSEHCLFEWDFDNATATNYSGNGDNRKYHPENNKTKIRCSDYRLEVQTDVVTNSAFREVSLSSDQNCMIGVFCFPEVVTDKDITVTVRNSDGTDTDVGTISSLDAPGPHNSWSAVNGWTVLDIDSYASIGQAVTAANSAGDKVVLRLNSDEDYTISSTLSITATNFWMLTKDIGNASIIKDGSWIAGSSASLVKILGSICRIENITLLGSSGSSIYDMIGISIDAEEVVVTECVFRYFAKYVISNNDYFYLQNNKFYDCTNNAVEGNGSYFVAHGNFWAEDEAAPAQSVDGYLFDIGRDTGSSSVYGCSLAFNRMRFKGTVSSFSPTVFIGGGGTNDYPSTTATASSTGPVRFSHVDNASIYHNTMTEGGSQFEIATSNVRIDGNLITNGGILFSININNGAQNVVICNNILQLNPNADYSSGIIYGHDDDGLSGSIDSIYLISNTCILSDNIRTGIGGPLNFRENGRTINENAFRVYNNIFAADSSFVSYLIGFDDPDDNHVVFSDNVYPDKLDESPIARIDDTRIFMGDYLATYDPNGSREKFRLDEFKTRIFYYYVDDDLYTNVGSTNIALTNAKSCLRDFHGVIRSFGESGSQKGAVDTPSGVFDAPDTSDFSVTWNDVTRTRGSGQGDCDDGYFEIRDPENNDILIYGLNNQSVQYLFEHDDYRSVGDYVRTDISTTIVSNGIDIEVVFTNDGPGGQDNDEEESVEQRMGQTSLNMWTLGRVINAMRNRTWDKWPEFENYDGNVFNLAIYEYPGSKEFPLIAIRNKDYVCGVSVMWNIEGATGLFFQEGVIGSDNRSWATSTNWYDSKIGGSSWYSLREGDSVTVTFSVRVKRSPRHEDWVTIAEPYKDYFWNKYGSYAEYCKDPRPISQELIATPENVTSTNTFGYSGGRGYGGPSKNGWRAFIGHATDLNNANIQRFMMWTPSGIINYNPTYNFPFIMWSRFYDGNRTIVDGIYTGDRDYVVGEVTDLGFVNEIPLMEDLAFNFPKVGYYWGRTTEPMAGDWDTLSKENMDFNNSTHLGLYNLELDYMANEMRCGAVGLDAYAFRNSSDNDNWVTEEIALLDHTKERWPHVNLLVEKTLPDFLHIKAGNFYLMRDLDGHVNGYHNLADYIIPGHESWAQYQVVPYRNVLDSFTFQTEDGQLLKTLRDVASYGFVPLATASVEDMTLDDVESDAHAADTWWRYHSRPADNGAPATPADFEYLFERNQALFSEKYNILRWTANTEADMSHYEVWRAIVTVGVPDTDTFIWVDNIFENTFYDRAFKPDQDNVYKIRAVDKYGNKSGFTSESRITRLDNTAEILPPIEVIAQSSSQNATITINWQEPG